MRKIIVQEYVTLDGFIEDPNDQQMRWVTRHFNAELAQEIAGWAAGTDTILLGRITYEILNSYWPSDMAKNLDPVMYKHMNEAHKIVFSTTLKNAGWTNSKIHSSIDPAEIQKLKQQPGKDITISGSASIVHALANLNLIDKYYLMVFPLAIGNGKSVYSDKAGRINLRLTDYKTFSNGVIALQYDVAQ